MRRVNTRRGRQRVGNEARTPLHHSLDVMNSSEDSCSEPPSSHCRSQLIGAQMCHLLQTDQKHVEQAPTGWNSSSSLPALTDSRPDRSAKKLRESPSNKSLRSDHSLLLMNNQSAAAIPFVTQTCNISHGRLSPSQQPPQTSAPRGESHSCPFSLRRHLQAK